MRASPAWRPLACHWRKARGPVRVGLLAAKTGPLASGGIDMELALAMFLKERDNTLAGRKIELIVADTAGVPATARTKAQELIEKNNVHCLIGPLAAFEALAIADYLTEKEMPTIGVAAAEDMTQRHPSPWFVRPTSTSAQCAYPLADYSAKELKYKRIVTIADDFAYGHEMCAGFQRAFEDNGGKIIQKIFTPLATPDYGSYVAQVKGADAIFLGTAGSNGFRFLRQFIEYGLKDKMAVIGGMTALDESVLRNMGDEALGILTTSWYSAELDNPLNKAFAPAFRKQFKYDPGFYAAGTYCRGRGAGSGAEGHRRQGGRQEGVHGGDPRQQRRHRARRGEIRRIRQCDRQRLYPQGDAQRRPAGQFGDQDLSRRQPVLDLRQGRVPEEPGLLARLSAGQEPGASSSPGDDRAKLSGQIGRRCSFGSSRVSTACRSAGCCSCCRRDFP